VRAVLRTV